MPAPVRIDLGEVPTSLRPFAAAILREPDAAPSLLRLLGMLGTKVPGPDACSFALLLRRHLPRSSRLDRVSEVFIREKYPAWYIRAVNDSHRNAAYRRAIEALVTPESVVLEAGTGSGLFAMMAARAGAAHVHTCEPDSQVAQIARDNIVRNGFADRITLHQCRCEDLADTAHLPRPADIFIHEFVGSQFVVRKMGSMLDHLRGRLIADKAAILPHRFAAVGILVGDEGLLEAIRVPPRIEGLDVGAVNLLALAEASFRGPLLIEVPLSEATELAAFDMLSGGSPAQPARRIGLRTTVAGAATGILQWIRQGFPDGSVYENSPDRACNWYPTFWPFPEPIGVVAGGTVHLSVETTDAEIFIDPAG